MYSTGFVNSRTGSLENGTTAISVTGTLRVP